jgi:hypothetical protein
MGELINFIPYFEALKKIKNGTPVDDLVKIKNSFEESLLEGELRGREVNPFYCGVDNFEFNHIDLFGDAENSILCGYSPELVYDGWGVDSFLLRRTCLHILRDVLERYDSKM